MCRCGWMAEYTSPSYQNQPQNVTTQTSYKLDVCGSVHHSTIHKENPTRCNNASKFIIPCLYEARHVSGNTPPIIRSLKLYWQPLVSHTWKVVGHVAGRQRPPATRPTTFHVWKTRGCQCSFKLLMMGGVSPETCWASHKHRIINFDALLHLVEFCLWIKPVSFHTTVKRTVYWLPVDGISYKMVDYTWIC
jgi:hypothetical protein